MSGIAERWLTSEVESALSLSKTVKWLKVIMALILCVAYFTGRTWLTELLVISMVLQLLLPLGFFDVFIQKLLEYNTSILEERQILNANETNNTFDKVFASIDKNE